MERQQWKSNLGFLAAAVGSAVGLGNIWRFSYVCYENGGGAFLIPYFIALFTAGIPLMILEFGLGHRKQGSAPKSLHLVAPHWEWLGWYSVLFVMFGIMLYYSVVISWCVNYLGFSFTLDWGEETGKFFGVNFLNAITPGKDGHGALNLGSIRWNVLGTAVFVWALFWLICFREINKGIELVCKAFIPVLLLLIVILVVWSSQLDGAWEGIKAYLTPDFKRLFGRGASKIWLAAYGQIFFSLSLGFGIMIAYASYLDRQANIAKLALITACSNSFVEVFAGFAVFSTLGFMAAQKGVPVSEVAVGGGGLAFIVYPAAINQLPFGNIAFGVIFFLALVIAGISSAISIIEAFTCALEDKFGWKRINIVTVACAIGFLGSMLYCTQAGPNILDITDQFLNTYGLVVVGLMECVILSYFYKMLHLREHVDRLSKRRWSFLWANSVKFFVPLILIYMLTQNLIDEITPPFFGGYPGASILVFGVAFVVVALIGGIVFSLIPWRRPCVMPEYEYEKELE
ncbi:sodium-dependent transporter [Candidatus Sumerlaeota bacterium]|nr:sodium-dependent transporter [Candidatus Sumerlaeota bacterium]